MNKETYEALKLVVEMALRDKEWSTPKDNAVALVREWIDEVAKEYEPYDNENEDWKKILRGN